MQRLTFLDKGHHKQSLWFITTCSLVKIQPPVWYNSKSSVSFPYFVLSDIQWTVS